jgi:phenolic acid decarboxylase
VFLSTQQYGNGWFLSVYAKNSQTSDSGIHLGHRKLCKELIRTDISRLDQETLSLVNNCQEVGLTGKSAALLVNAESSTNLTAGQIYYLKTKSAFDKKEIGCTMTAAEQLVNYFETKEVNASYVMVLHDTNKLLLIAKPWGGKKNTHDLTRTQLEEEIKEQMTIHTATGRKKSLLLFAWVTDEELRMARMFGTVMSFDCTAQTNRQKRDLFTVTIKDGNNKLCTCCRAFVANERQFYIPIIVQSRGNCALGC